MKARQAWFLSNNLEIAKHGLNQPCQTVAAVYLSLSLHLQQLLTVFTFKVTICKYSLCGSVMVQILWVFNYLFINYFSYVVL